MLSRCPQEIIQLLPLGKGWVTQNLYMKSYKRVLIWQPAKTFQPPSLYIKKQSSVKSCSQLNNCLALLFTHWTPTTGNIWKHKSTNGTIILGKQLGPVKSFLLLQTRQLSPHAWHHIWTQTTFEVIWYQYHQQLLITGVVNLECWYSL